MPKTPYRPATLAAHAGEDLLPPTTDGLAPSIERSTTFRFENSEELRGYNAGKGPKDGLYLYTRYENPTVRATEARLAAMEGAEGCLLFASGMAAIATLALAHLTKGRGLLCSTVIYGGAYRLFRDQLRDLGLNVTFREPGALLADDWPANVGLLFVESPTNPGLRVLDLAGLAERAHKAGAALAVDGTFATPVLQRPLALGADLVVHSATKYLGGHSDLLAGAVLGSAAQLAPIEKWRRSLGGVLPPDEAYQLGRSLATLELRMLRHSENAADLASRLYGDRRVAKVHYPGLGDHPDRALVERQMRTGGGMLTLELAGGLPAARRCFDRFKLIARAVSLGGFESCAALPVETSHIGCTPAELASCGVSEGMVRLSIGLEDVEDLWADLDQALGA